MNVVPHAAVVENCAFGIAGGHRLIAAEHFGKPPDHHAPGGILLDCHVERPLEDSPLKIPLDNASCLVYIEL